MITEEQAKELKKQIIQQIESWDRPDEFKDQAKKQVEAMSPQELEKFLMQNKLITEKKQSQQECPFCLILQGKAPCFKIAENEDTIAILEINPISEGHAIIVPKKHLPSDKIPMSSLELAKKVSEKIKSVLNPQDVNLSTANIMGHGVINVVPFYGAAPEKREKASQKKLKSLQEKLKIEEKKKKPSKPKKLEKAPRRIP